MKNMIPIFLLVAVAFATAPVITNADAINYGALLEKGIAHFQNGQPYKAIEQFEKAREMKPGFHESWDYLGFSYPAFGNARKALKRFQKAAVFVGVGAAAGAAAVAPGEGPVAPTADSDDFITGAEVVVVEPEPALQPVSKPAPAPEQAAQPDQAGESTGQEPMQLTPPVLVEQPPTREPIEEGAPLQLPPEPIAQPADGSVLFVADGRLSFNVPWLPIDDLIAEFEELARQIPSYDDKAQLADAYATIMAGYERAKQIKQISNWGTRVRLFDAINMATSALQKHIRAEGWTAVNEETSLVKAGREKIEEAYDHPDIQKLARDLEINAPIAFEVFLTLAHLYSSPPGNIGEILNQAGEFIEALEGDLAGALTFIKDSDINDKPSARGLAHSVDIIRKHPEMSAQHGRIPFLTDLFFGREVVPTFADNDNKDGRLDVILAGSIHGKAREMLELLEIAWQTSEIELGSAINNFSDKLSTIMPGIDDSYMKLLPEIFELIKLEWIYFLLESERETLERQGKFKDAYMVHLAERVMDTKLALQQEKISKMSGQPAGLTGLVSKWDKLSPENLNNIQDKVAMALTTSRIIVVLNKLGIRANDNLKYYLNEVHRRKLGREGYLLVLKNYFKADGDYTRDEKTAHKVFKRLL
ncbi:MAG: hypothetical protein GY835_28430 [bacterium]|nr:hypothetical protein [bacterium]